MNFDPHPTSGINHLPVVFLQWAFAYGKHEKTVTKTKLRQVKYVLPARQFFTTVHLRTTAGAF